jgi:drug/metabolite transporter (DMT)-like permease
MTEPGRQPGTWISFALCSLIWGSTWLVITGQLGGVPPPWSVAYRFLIGASVMFVYARATVGSVRLDGEGHLFALLYGVPQFCFQFNAVYFAEQHVTSGLVAVIYAVLLVPNALFAWLFLKHRITPRFLLGSIVAIVGVGLLLLQELRAHPGDIGALMKGAAFALFGIVSASAANIIQAGDRIRIHSLPAMIAWGMLYGTMADAILAWSVYGPPALDFRVTYLAGLAYLGIVASALVFSLYFPLVRTIGPGKAAYIGLVTPIIAMLLSSVFESYQWTFAAFCGGLLVLGGLFIALRSARNPS